MTNRERVLALIRSKPAGLTDSEIREQTGIQPHQQVNRICRGLAQAHLIERRTGPQGRLVNFPSDSPPRDLQPNPRSAPRAKSKKPSRMRSCPADASEIPPVSISTTLVILPCSGRKRRGGQDTAACGTSVLHSLPEGLATELRNQRSENAPQARLDESALLRAADRYAGTLYRAAGDAIDVLVKAGAGVLIISGGYGVVRPTEPIGWYKQVYRNALWPEDLVARCLEAYAEATAATSVIAFLSASSPYAKTFRKTHWPDRVDQALCVCPESTAGAMTKAPRAQGEALQVFSRNHALHPDWTSSDGLRMQITRLR